MIITCYQRNQVTTSRINMGTEHLKHSAQQRNKSSKDEKRSKDNMSNPQHNKQHYTRITHHPTNQHEPTITSTHNNDKRNSPHSGWMSTPTHHITLMLPWSPVIFLFFFIPPSHDTIPPFVLVLFFCFLVIPYTIYIGFFVFLWYSVLFFCFFWFLVFLVVLLICFQLSKYFHTITYHHFVLGFWGGFCTRIPRFFVFSTRIPRFGLFCYTIP